MSCCWIWRGLDTAGILHEIGARCCAKLLSTHETRRPHRPDGRPALRFRTARPVIGQPPPLYLIHRPAFVTGTRRASSIAI